MGYAAAALTAAMLLPRFEHYFFKEFGSTMSAAAGIAICSSIASGMIALTGIVFSLTFVMMQFSASAYSPRLVLWVARDPVVSHALGVFTATFLYALGMLAWIDREAQGRVPGLSGWITLFLLLASMGMFIALIHRVGLLQVNRMLTYTGDEGRKAIEERRAHLPPPAAIVPDPLPPETQTLRHAGRPQVLQSVDLARLTGLARTMDAVLELRVLVGDTLLEGTPLVGVRGAAAPIDPVALLEALDLGDERTFEQDPKYALRLVVDIAIKALSPAINDPTTAVQALDQIEDLLIRLGRAPAETGRFADANGRLRVIAPFPTWEDLLRLGLDEIAAYGADSVQVMRRMKALIRNLLGQLPAGRHEALRQWDQRLERSISRSFDDHQDKREALVADRQGLGGGQAPPASGPPAGAPAVLPAAAPRSSTISD